jgi:alkylhydroperoxidase family enzyme
MLLQQLGFSAEQVRALEEDIDRADLSEKERAILAFAGKSTTAPLSVTDGDVERLKGYGLTDAEIVEVQGVMELFTGYKNLSIPCRWTWIFRRRVETIIDVYAISYVKNGIDNGHRPR